MGYPRGKWTLEVVFINGPPQSGSIMEWTLLLHGTKDAPYTNLPVSDPHSKLGGQEGSRDEEEDVGGQSSAADLSRGPVFLSPSSRIHPAVGCPTACVHQDQYYKLQAKQVNINRVNSMQSSL